MVKINFQLSYRGVGEDNAVLEVMGNKHDRLMNLVMQGE